MATSAQRLTFSLLCEAREGAYELTAPLFYTGPHLPLTRRFHLLDSRFGTTIYLDMYFTYMVNCCMISILPTSSPATLHLWLPVLRRSGAQFASRVSSRGYGTPRGATFRIFKTF